MFDLDHGQALQVERRGEQGADLAQRVCHLAQRYSVPFLDTAVCSVQCCVVCSVVRPPPARWRHP
jgi:hypothetical protein